MNWANPKERDLELERQQGFDETLDYMAEYEQYMKLFAAHDVPALQAFFDRHNGQISFAAKLCYYKTMKAAGLL